MSNVLLCIPYYFLLFPNVFTCLCTFLSSLCCALCPFPRVTPPAFAWVPLYDYTKLHICRRVQCITVSYWASVGPVLCAPRFLLCISLYASFFVTCSVSCTFCVYVICAPSHLAPRIPFLYTVVSHTLSVCRFSTLRRFGRFASDCIYTIGTCLEGLLFTSLRLHLPSLAHARFR